ncbi:MAG: hypothetical protein HY788_08565 [Deltaproteobacteria bacterium]|nr:hypothetical protein [Deltaproteobacteria bacterium]
MSKIPTVQLYYPEGGMVRVNEDRADVWRDKGWLDEPPKTRPKPNLKAVGKKSGDE